MNNMLWLSVYFDSLNPVEPILQQLQSILMLHRDLRWVLATDTNSWHERWFSTAVRTNQPQFQRGDLIADWIENNRGICLNVYSEHTTYESANGTCSNIDCTFTNARDTFQWELLDLVQDHRMISFFSHGSSMSIRTQLYTDWTLYRRTVEDLLQTSNDEISIERFQRACRMSRAFSVKEKRGLARKPKWWTCEVKTAYRLQKRLYKRWTRNRNDLNRKTEYKAARTDFTNKLANSRKNSHRDFLESINERSRGSYKWLLHRLTGRERSNAVMQLKMDNELIPPQACAQTLLNNAFFQTTDPTKPAISQDIQTQFHDAPTHPLIPISTAELMESLRRMPNRGASGLDHLSVRHLKNLPQSALDYLANAFTRLFAEGRIPIDWMRIRVGFIPKPGKDKSSIKSYRPISIMSVLSRLYDKILTRRLTSRIESSGLMPDFQHGFRSGRSTESLLACLASEVDSHKSRSKHVLISSIDLSKAFDKLHPDLPMRFLMKLQLIQPDCYALTRAIMPFLGPRRMITSFGGYKGEIITNIGVPQGSALSPNLFSMGSLEILANTQLKSSLYLYVDDITLVTAEGTLTKALTQAKDDLGKLAEVLATRGLPPNPQKSKVLILQKKGATLPTEISVLGEPIAIVDSLNLLGVQFNSKWEFREHLLNKVHQGRMLILNMMRFSRLTWGISSELCLHFFKIVAASRLYYCVSVWGRVLQFQYAVDILEKFQALAGRLIMRSFKKSPRKLAAGLPFQFRLIDAMKAKVIRGLTGSTWSNQLSIPRGSAKNTLHSSLRQFMTEFRIPHDPIEFVPQSSFFRQEDIIIHFQCQSRKDAIDTANNFHTLDECYFTDASRDPLTQKVSSAYIHFRYGIETSRKAVPHGISLTVFEAELSAIEMVLDDLDQNNNSIIFTDSKSSILAIQAWRTTHHIVNSIWTLLKTKSLRIIFVWVPGHEDVAPNEMVDQLAKETLQNSPIPRTRLSKQYLITFLKDEVKHRFRTWWFAENPCKYLPDMVAVEKYNRHCLGSTYIAQVLTGCNLLNSYLRFITGVPNICPLCSQSPDSVSHVIFHCDKLAGQRESLLRAIPNPPASASKTHFVRWIILDKNRCMRFIRFLKETGRFSFAKRQ